MKKVISIILIIAVLLTGLTACGGAAGAPSESAVFSSAPEQNTDDYVNRYPGEYNTEISGYSNIQIKDSAGNDISHIVIDLWYAANEIYNVDDMKMFEMGEYEATLSEYTVQSNELLNYYAVVESVFTQNGIMQLEQTMIGGPEPLIRKNGDKIYRMGAWKSGYSFAHALTDMQVKELTGNTITLAVTYASINRYNTTVTVDFTIANVDGRWLVDDYIYPEAYHSTSASPAAVDLTDLDGLFKTYMYPIRYSAATYLGSWTDPNDIDADMLVDMYGYMKIWLAGIPESEMEFDGETPYYYLDEAILEDYVQSYFTVSVDHLHSSDRYKADRKAYAFDMSGVGFSYYPSVLRAEYDESTNILVLYLDDGYGEIEGEAAALTIQLNEDGSFKYVSNNCFQN